MLISPEISNLRLCSAFKHLACDILSCIEVENLSYVYVIDDENNKFSRFAKSNEDLSICFCGINPKNHNLHLLAIDNKLMTNVPGGIADCALFNSEHFALIEFKTNAEGNTLASIEYTYQKAIDQLKNTIHIFSTRLNTVRIDFYKQINIAPYIVVSSKFPRSQAMEQNYAMQFANDTLLELNFGSSHIF